MRIRDERSDDGDAITAVITAAFADAGGGAAEAGLVGALRRDGDAVLSLVAEERTPTGGVVCGHILFSRLAAPSGALALAPVSVVPRLQRRGVGRALVRVGLDRVRREGWRTVFVLGDPNYYRRFGFDAAAAERFRTPYAGPYFMAIGFPPSRLARMGRKIVYPRAFDDLEA